MGWEMCIRDSFYLPPSNALFCSRLRGLGGLDRRVLAGLIVVPMAATGVWVGLHYAKIKQQSGRSLGLLAPPVNEFLDRSDPISLERLRRRRSG